MLSHSKRDRAMTDFTELRQDLLADLHHPVACALPWEQIHVGGGEAESFLQGQLTVDLARLHPDQPAICAWCNAKGRVWTLLYALREGDGFRLLVPAGLSEALCRRMRMFVLRADVTLTPLPDAQLIGHIDPAGHASGCWPLNAWQAVSSQGEPADSTALPLWQVLRMLDGEAQFLPAHQEQYLPQSLGLREGRGLHFNKGCYVGQEIVARLHYRGRPPYALQLFIDAAPPEKASELLSITLDGRRFTQAVVPAKP